MTIVVPDTAEVQLLSILLNKTAASNVVYHLYKNNITPSESTVLANFTESTAAGYAAITLSGASWTVSTLGGVSTASHAQITYTYSTNENVYGYYVTNTGSSSLLWSEVLPSSPFSLPISGGLVGLTPRITLD